MDIVKILHLRGIFRFCALFLVNKVYAGVKPKHFEKKRKLLNLCGCQIGEGTKIVAPITFYRPFKVGERCWIGKNFCINGNGLVTIGDNCDIAPDVIFSTGGHKIGTNERRAGEGEIYDIHVGDGNWICTRATIQGPVEIGNGTVIAACACVVHNVSDNTLVGGVPARLIKNLY